MQDQLVSAIGEVKMRNKSTKRQFIKQTLATGAAVAASSIFVKAQPAPQTLSLYVVVWNSYGKEIPWRHQSPKVVVEAATHVIWSYIQNVKDNPLRTISQGSVIGHTALYAKLSNGPELVFSNTGGNVGFYRRGHPKHDRHFDRSSWILASFHVGETLAGHLSDGSWETIDEFRDRVHARRAPRVQRLVLAGQEAQDTFALLQSVAIQKNSDPARGGGPRHFGLNTTGVRLIHDFNTVLPMQKYDIAGQHYEIHGGCGNAVASVLRAARLERLVPDGARVKMTLNVERFREKVVPVIIGSNAFNSNERAQDPDLTKALESLPQTWGSTDELRFCDPNYWFRLMSHNPLSYRDLMRDLRI
jgi:hypothetical protein